MSATIYLALDGCHGTGTSSHADALAEALGAERFRAVAYHHPRHPEGCNGAARVAWYAGARAQLAALPPAPIVVMDRGPTSGVVYADAVGEGYLLATEDVTRWAGRGLAWVHLTADADTLDARIRARGEKPREFLAERSTWGIMAALGAEASPRWRTVDTGRPSGPVRAELLAWALGVIRGRTGL